MIEGKDPRQMTTSPALPAWWRRWRAKRVQRLNHKYQRQEWIRTAQLAPFDPPPPLAARAAAAQAATMSRAHWLRAHRRRRRNRASAE